MPHYKNLVDRILGRKSYSSSEAKSYRQGADASLKKKLKEAAQDRRIEKMVRSSRPKTVTVVRKEERGTLKKRVEVGGRDYEYVRMSGGEMVWRQRKK